MTAAGQQITAEEAAIVRAWLGGHKLTEIAKARKVEHADVARVILDTCGQDRAVARAWLEGGDRPVGKRHPAVAPRPVAAAGRPPAPVGTWHDQFAPAARQAPTMPFNRPEPVREVRRIDPRLTAVADAARALTGALRAPGVAWDRIPWGALTDLMRAVDQVDDPVVGAATPPSPQPPPEPLERWTAHRCDQCRHLGLVAEHDPRCPGQLHRTILLVMPDPEE